MTDKGAIAADNVVLALGSYSPIVGRKLGLRLPVYPIKGYSVTLPVDGYNAHAGGRRRRREQPRRLVQDGPALPPYRDGRVLRLRHRPPARRTSPA